MKIKRIIKLIPYIIFLFIYLFGKFVNEVFYDMSFEQLLYNVMNTEGANYSVVGTGAIYIFSRLGVILLILFLIYGIIKIINNKFNIKINKFFLSKKFRVISIILFGFISLFLTIKLLNIDEFIIYQNTKTNLYEKYYVDGKKVELKFPKNKKNLIYIFAESMETTNTSKENGGNINKSYIPKLEKLALENTNFSNTNKLGGAMQVENTGWTMAGLIAHTSGVPLKLSALKTLDKNFLPGVYSLGDILKDNGYNNYFMIGSDARFGGRENYFKNHGSYTIYDYYYAIDNNFIESDYHVWWGYEDYKLFNHAKEKIKEASKLDKPFNFTILTVDTHFTDGYMDDSCKDVFDSKYANSLYCSDSKIYSFIKWIQKQDFYKDTVIIITGDHLTMQYDFYDDNDYQRTIYNTIINSKLIPKKEKNRLFSSFDMFPTTLASLGVKIEGNKLGLGVNLYSEEETLIEKLGYDKLNKEIMKKSVYYNNELLN